MAVWDVMSRLRALSLIHISDLLVILNKALRSLNSAQLDSIIYDNSLIDQDAVSYTHLDVYKRQSVASATSKNVEAWLMRVVGRTMTGVW